MRERRIGELSQLQSELSQSMRKKEEVEQVIRRELRALFPVCRRSSTKRLPVWTSWVGLPPSSRKLGAEGYSG